MSNSAGEADGRGRRRINSIEVGFRLLRALESAGKKIQLKILAERAGMPPSKAYLYMVSFMQVGLVIQDPQTSHYGLGPYAIQLGLAAIRQLDVFNLAGPALESLQVEFGLAAYISVWGNLGPTIIRKLNGEFEGPIRTQVGHVVPMLSTATGRVFLAYLPRDKTQGFVEKERLYDAGLLSRAEEAAQAAQKLGVATSSEYFGASAVSAPIFDYSGSIVATLTIYGISIHVDVTPDGAQANAVRTAAADISCSLGYLRDKDQTQVSPPSKAARQRPQRKRS